MAKKFKPTSSVDDKLDELVKKGYPTKTSRNESDDLPEVVRVNNGYRLRKDFIDKVALLAAIKRKKKYEIVEEGLEMVFEKYKDVLDRIS